MVKKKSIIQQVFFALLVSQLLAGCAKPQVTAAAPSPAVIQGTTEPKAVLEGTPSITLVPTTANSTSTPDITKTPLRPQTAFLEDCPAVASQISNGLDEGLYLYLRKTLYQYKTLDNRLAPITQVDLNTTRPLYLSPDGKTIYWVKDGTLTLFDVDRAKISATYALPEGSGHGAGWTNDGNLRLEKLEITDDSDLTGLTYTILDPTNFQTIKQQAYDLVNYTHFAVSVKYGGFVAVSPDGSKVLYSGLEQQDDTVVLYDAVQDQILWKSEKFKWVNDLGGYPANTIWTNDGQWAVFAAARNQSDPILFAISADGTELVEVWVLKPEIWQTEKLFEFSTEGVYHIIGKNFVFR